MHRTKPDICIFLPRGESHSGNSRLWIDSLFGEPASDQILSLSEEPGLAPSSRTDCRPCDQLQKTKTAQQATMPACYSSWQRQLRRRMEYERVERKTGNARRRRDARHADTGLQGAVFILCICGKGRPKVIWILTERLSGFQHDISLNKMFSEPTAAHTAI